MNNTEIGFLFDLDGVLIDSEHEYTRIWSEIDQMFPTGVENFAMTIKGETLPEILNNNFSAYDKQNIIDELNRREQKMHYPWLPGAKELLEEIKTRGYKMVLVTSSNDTKMRHLKEERPDLLRYFDDIVTANRVSKSKPDPEGYQLGASLIGLPPSQCIVFEDSAQGVKAGRAAGAYVIGLTTTLPATSLEAYSDQILETLADTDLDTLIKRATANKHI